MIIFMGANFNTTRKTLKQKWIKFISIKKMIINHNNLIKLIQIYTIKILPLNKDKSLHKSYIE